MSLKISKDLSLPLEAVTQTFAILAMRRIGKTYTASVMAEEFVANCLPFVVLDPTGAWWGLRSSADGKSEGLPVIIIGGEHGDVPLEPTAGAVIADVVVDHPGYYVIDLSSTESNSAQDRFATDFAERLYRRKNEVRSPLHLFVDEADSFAPQRPLPSQHRMLGAFEALVRRGGIRGIGTTLITQRAAVLNKNVLTQTDTLFVLQINSTQDQDAIEDWIKRNGTKEQTKSMMDSLASLPMAHAWFWSPGWMRTFKQIHIRQRRTFNSSATPKAGEKAIVPQRLAQVDIARLGERIAETIERVAENDPSALKRTIADLKHKVQKLEQSRNAAPRVETKTEVREISVLTGTQEKLLEDLADWASNLKQSLQRVSLFASEVVKLRQEIIAARTAIRIPSPVIRRPINTQVKTLPAPKIVSVEAETSDISLGKCEKSILAVLRQYPQGRSAIQIAVLTGYSPNSGAFNGALTKLRSLGFVERSQPITITESGSAWLGDNWEPLPTGQALAEYWINRLPKCESAILKFLTQIYPEGKTSQELALETGYSANSGAFNGALTKLRTLELVARGQPIKTSDHLFQ